MPKKKQAVPYTEAFRKEAIRRSEQEGIIAVQVATEPGIHVNQIYNWRLQYKQLSKGQFATLKGVDYSKDETMCTYQHSRKHIKPVSLTSPRLLSPSPSDQDAHADA